MGSVVSCLNGEDVEDNVMHSFYGGIPWSHDKSRDPFKFYEVVSFLGKGSLGEVYKVRKQKSAIGGSAFANKNKNSWFRATQRSGSDLEIKEKLSQTGGLTEYALKKIIVDKMSNEFVEELKNEIAILRELDHPHIVKAYEIFDYKQQIYVLLELCSGGDLWTRAPYSERDARDITKQMLSAIFYMHKKNIIHRDLKLENIMFESSHPKSGIKLLDFGLSKKVRPGDKLSQGVGTLYTMAPGVLKRVYTSQADMWSIGVIVYVLLSNRKPFTGRSRKYVLKKISTADYNFNAMRWKGISANAKEFISKLIELDPNIRYTAERALQSPWILQEGSVTDNKPDNKFMTKIFKSLKNHSEDDPLKKIALMVIAQKSSSKDILKLREAFDQYDETHDGQINLTDFLSATANLGCTPNEAKEVFDSLDGDKNGVIDYTEFLAATLEAQGKLEEFRIADAFDRIDCDDDGYITNDNLKTLLGTDYSPEIVEKAIAKLDVNRDGKVSFGEFKTAFQRQRTLESQQSIQLIYDGDGLNVHANNDDRDDDSFFNEKEIEL